MLSNTLAHPIKSAMFADVNLITYELVFSAALDMIDREHFRGSLINAAITQAAAKITEFNNNPNIKNAYVVLSRLPDEMSSAGRNILSWTKPFSDDSVQT